MAKYPTRAYGKPNGLGSEFFSRQFVGSSSAISGSSGGGITTLTETWEIKAGAEQLQDVTSPYGANNQYTGKRTDPTNVKAWGYMLSSILGWGISRGKDKGINRDLPVQHPEIPNLWASRVSNLQGIGTDGQASASLRASWKLVRFDVTYETPPYNIYSNDATAAIAVAQGSPADSPGEQYRFVIPDFEPSLEFVQRRRGGFRFPKINGQSGVLTGQAIQDPNGQSLRLVKRRYTFTWCQVPDVGLFSGGGFYAGGFATNIENALGRVNADKFFGYDPGTLLFESWKPIPKTYPKTLQGLNVFPRCWDVRLVFNHFNPTIDKNDPAKDTKINIDGVQYQIGTGGHNMVPHPTKKVWYRAILKDPAFPKAALDNNQDAWKYQFAVFDNIFRMCA